MEKFYEGMKKKARAYWEKRLGKVETLWNGKPCLIHGSHTLFDAKPLRQTGGGLLVHAREQYHYREMKLERTVFYPKLDDVHHFASTVKNLKDDAPARSFPGAVGLVIYTLTPHQVVITDAQGCFKQGTGTLSTETERKYSGWLSHAFSEPFDHALREGKTFVEFRVAPKELAKKQVKKHGVEAVLPDTIHVFARVAQQLGFKVTSTRIKTKKRDFVICRAINPKIHEKTVQEAMKKAAEHDFKTQNETYTPTLLTGSYVAHYDEKKPNQKPPLTINGPPRALYRKNKRIRPLERKR